jgi:biopolymer transport protein ExbD
MRYLEPRKARIEIVPMIDIMFFLLVFFVMITLRMIPATGVSAQLPHSSTAEQMPHPKALVTLQEDGSVALDGQAMPLEAVTQHLASGDAAHTAVTVASVKQASVQQLMAVIDAVRAAGVTQLGLAAQQQP